MYKLINQLAKTKLPIISDLQSPQQTEYLSSSSPSAMPPCFIEERDPGQLNGNLNPAVNVSASFAKIPTTILT